MAKSKDECWITGAKGSTTDRRTIFGNKVKVSDKNFPDKKK